MHRVLQDQNSLKKCRIFHSFSPILKIFEGQRTFYIEYIFGILIGGYIRLLNG